MKKTLLVLFGLSITGLLSAQSLSLSHDGADLSNDTLFVVGTTETTLLEAFVVVKNLTDKEIEVGMKKGEVSVVENSENSFCWGACYPPFVFEATEPVEIAANGSDANSFIGDYTPDIVDEKAVPGTSIIRYTFYVDGNPSDSVSLFVSYQIGSAGRNDWTVQPSLFRAYPNPTSGRLTVDFPGSGNQQIYLKVLAITGQTVLERHLGFGQSTVQIDLGQVPRGYYFLQIEDQNGKQALRKILKSN